MIEYNLDKKGLIVVGTPRSGSHAITDYLFKTFNHVGRYPVFNGEILSRDPVQWIDDVDKKRSTNLMYTFNSLVDHTAKSKFMANLNVSRNYQLINIRRRNKIEHFISLCLHNSTDYTYVPKYENYKHLLPLKVGVEQVQNFINDIEFDKKFNWGTILYYEDVMLEYNKLNNKSFLKNSYPPFEQIIENFNEVKQILEEYSYEQE